MSYATQEAKKSPVGLTAAVAINGSLIAAIMMSPMVINPTKPTHDIKVKHIPLQKIPEKEIEKPKKAAKNPRKTDVFTPFTPTQFDTDNELSATTDEPVDQGYENNDSKDEDGDAGAAIIPDPIVKKPPLPIFAAAVRDSRFAKDFQPRYPRGLLRKEIMGTARVRVLIGTNGRVRKAVVVSASHPDFGKATVRQALRKWRFKPATRDGKPVEDWQTLSVRFNITE